MASAPIQVGVPHDQGGSAEPLMLELLESDAFARFSQAGPSVAKAWGETWPCED